MNLKTRSYRYRPRRASWNWEEPEDHSTPVVTPPTNHNGESSNGALSGPPSSVLSTVDQFVAAVPWTIRRMVLVYLRHHGGRTFVRLRTFNRHKKLGCWYPAPRYYVVPKECALDLAKAIEAAASGERYGPEPEWYRDFEKQYNARRERESYT